MPKAVAMARNNEKVDRVQASMKSLHFGDVKKDADIEGDRRNREIVICSKNAVAHWARIAQPEPLVSRFIRKKNIKNISAHFQNR